MMQLLQQRVWQFLKRLNLELLLPYDVAREKKTYVHTHTHLYANDYKAALFMLAPRWKQLKAPSAGELTKCCPPMQRNLIQPQKGLTDRHTPRHEGTLETVS